ncbi:MAG: inositol-3-phosphate synthase, partial [Deltaproteobacteria bacterium]|nr:inositol-3-phosphate synthase [Deltaproteobacteria bacterium]
DLAQRAKFAGIQEWLSFYFKCPMAAQGLQPEHDLFVQQLKLQNTLRFLGDEEIINHLGLTYYGVNEESNPSAHL